jgi:hypothetical protein
MVTPATSPSKPNIPVFELRQSLPSRLRLQAPTAEQERKMPAGEQTTAALQPLALWLSRINNRWAYIVNTLIALVGGFYLAALPFWISATNPAGELPSIAVVLILTFGAILGGIAEWKLRSAVYEPDIEKLIEAANTLLKERKDYRPPSVPDISAVIAGLSLVCALIYPLIYFSLLIVFWPRDLATPSFWPVVAAVLVGEAIYLSWTFERVAMKGELEGLARRWAKESSDEKLTLSLAWAKRACELKAMLGLQEAPQNQKPQGPTPSPF